VRGIGAFKRGPRRLELALAEKAESFVKRHLVDLIGADCGGKAAADLRERLRLVRVQPNDHAAKQMLAAKPRVRTADSLMDNVTVR
jgi:hypothetical protein